MRSPLDRLGEIFVTGNENIDWFYIIPNWLSAIGTLAAVIVALWLSLRDRKLIIRGSATVYVMLDPQEKSSEEFVTVTFSNIGSRVINVTGISWRTGFFRKKFYWQIPKFNPYSSPMPIKLSDGDPASYHIPIKDFINNSRSTIAEGMPKIFKSIWVRSILVLVHTSTGQSLNLKLANNLRRLIITGKQSAH